MNRFLLLFLFFTTCLFSQQTEHVDFKTAKAHIRFGNLVHKEVIGTALYEFEILKDVNSIYIDANNFKSISYVLDGQIADSVYNRKQIIVKHSFKANTKHTIEVSWKTNPQKAMYFMDWEEDKGNKQIWTQGQGKYTSNWLPSIDDMNDKIEFDLTITFNKDYEVIANGKLINKVINDSTITWSYDMEHPMSSYLVALAIGKYSKKVETSESGIPLEMYYYSDPDSYRDLKFEPTFRYTKQLFEFLEESIGVPYPWQNYKQVPAKDFLYSGMENTSLTIFSDEFVIDSIAFVDKNYVPVNAHELAHQWFGNLVTETSGTHHWLHEGFATYYSLQAERHVFGDAFYYYKLFEYAQELKMQDDAGASTALLNPKSSSTTFYKKGAWALCFLRDKVGDKAFKKAVKSYLETHQFKNVETTDFIKEVEKASGKDLTEFVQTWLKSDVLHYDKLEAYLIQNAKDYKLFFELNCEDSKGKCLNFIASTKNNYLKAEVINSLKGDFPNSLYNAKDIKVRQALAQSVYDIPLDQKANYESLLKDPSYFTIEAALFNLWRNFPLERKKYLDLTYNVQGFNDKNIRILWLTLALITDDYKEPYKKRYLYELTDYTSPKYGYEVRQNAFQYLNQIQACKDRCKENLEQATKHHIWRFSKFAKTLINNLN